MDAVAHAAGCGGILTGMVLRLAPDLPILWRTPTSMQVGSSAVAVLDEVSDGEARLVAALAAGISETGFAMTARDAGVDADRAAALLERLGPALASDGTPLAARAAVLGDSALARSIAGLLSSGGMLATPDEAALVVLVGQWVLAPADHLGWLNRDVPHVPVLVAERSVEVGPFVEPGSGPCLYCVHLARTDADPSWPAVATQLLGRAGREVDELERAEVAAFVARRVQERLTSGRGPAVSWTLGAGGTTQSWAPHPGCRCRAGDDWSD